MLFDEVAKGIKRVKSEAQEAAKSLRHLTPQGNISTWITIMLALHFVLMIFHSLLNFFGKQR